MSRSLALLLSLVVATGAACSDRGEGSGHVVAAVYPLAYLAGEIVGDALEVETLTPPGAEPHDLELTPGQARSIAEAEIVIYLGGGFQPAVEEAVRAADNGLDVLELVSTRAGDEGSVDPHVWLDPAKAIEIAQAISKRLKDDEEGSSFDARLSDLTQRLEQLDRDLAGTLTGCERDTVVVSHEAFGYLTDRYGLTQVGIAGLNPEMEPSAQRLAEVSRFIEEENIDTIYLERLVPSDIGETLASETGASVLALDPLEVAPEEGDYLSAMLGNRDSLAEGLGCPGL